MHRKRLYLIICSVLVHLISIGANDTILEILKDEMVHVQKELQDETYPPYYMDFKVEVDQSILLVLQAGFIMDTSETTTIMFKPTFRIGDYTFDNTHQFKSDFNYFPNVYENCEILPMDLNPNGIRYKIYKAANNHYDECLSQFLTKKSELENRTDNSDEYSEYDFSKEKADVYFEPRININDFNIDKEEWIKRLKKYSGILEKVSQGFTLRMEFVFTLKRKYFISSEGAEIVQNKTIVALNIAGLGITDDSELIPVVKSYYASSPDGLPSDEEITNELTRFKDIVIELTTCQKAAPYEGPAILSPQAAGVFFHEIFGHRVEGHRMELSFNSKTFGEKIGERIIPKHISIIMDPTETSFNDIELIGHYKFDDEGIKSKRVNVVTNGNLENFLMSRKPIKQFSQSNGHGRSMLTSKPVARQSNMYILSKNQKSEQSLRKMLIKECKKQNKEFGYYFKEVVGGFTNTMNYMPDFFAVIPTEVYKIYVDGRPDELVRGVNVIGTPLMVFSGIIATGDKPGVFSGFCGAESGLLPVSTVSPSILIKSIETQNQFSPKLSMPILKSPNEF